MSPLPHPLAPTGPELGLPPIPEPSAPMPGPDLPPEPEPRPPIGEPPPKPGGPISGGKWQRMGLSRTETNGFQQPPHGDKSYASAILLQLPLTMGPGCRLE